MFAKCDRTEISREEFNLCLIKNFNYLETVKIACSIEEFNNESKLHEAVKNKAARRSPR